jgi:purine nucleosidase
MKNFLRISDRTRHQLLSAPHGIVDAVLDTDTYNEIDDPFALAYCMLSPERLKMKAVYAAPFFNARSKSPADGMEKSYHQIFDVLTRIPGANKPDFVFRGSTEFMAHPTKPVRSDAAEHLIELAHQKRKKPLYVIAIGAITNISSALVLDPSIAKKIVVVWLGGHPTYWPHTREFNLKQDPVGTRVLFDCGVPLVQVPCLGVTSHLLATVPELELYLKGRGALGNYLLKIFKDFHDDHFGWAKVIWDIAPVAWMINPEWVPSQLTPSPLLQRDITWKPGSKTRHLIRQATYVQRTPIFRDLFRKIEASAKGKKAKRETGKLCSYI